MLEHEALTINELTDRFTGARASLVARHVETLTLVGRYNASSRLAARSLQDLDVPGVGTSARQEDGSGASKDFLAVIQKLFNARSSSTSAMPGEAVASARSIILGLDQAGCQTFPSDVARAAATPSSAVTMASTTPSQAARGVSGVCVIPIRW
jgi:hypothetical protein